MSFSSPIKIYYQLTKPGIVYGNAIAAAAGFFLAAKGHVNWFLFLAMLIGISLVIASACVCNNCIDRRIDGKMERTKKRALVNRIIPLRNAITFAAILGIVGIALLYIYANLLTAFVAIVGFFFYVVIYGIWKRRSEWGTVVGSISGAVPPVIGYCSVTNRFDLGALILFLILVFWQMPHFYAIAIYRMKEYKAAGIPVLPLVRGIRETKIQIAVYIGAFTLTAVSLTIFHYTGMVYLYIILGLGLGWLVLAIKGFFVKNDSRWARQTFVDSLVVLLALSFMLSLSSFFRY